MHISRLIAAALAAACAYSASATTIDFDQLPGGAALPTGGTTISNQYASQGVTFSGTNSATGSTGALNAWGLIAATGPGGSRNYLGNFGAIPASSIPGPSDYLLAPRYDIMSVSFAGLASGISFGLYTGGGQNSVTVNAYDAAGVRLQSLANVMANNGRFELETLTATGVARLDVVGTFFSPGGSVRLFGIDNLGFTLDATGDVPEPASWALMIAGFGLVGLSLRRRAHAAGAVAA